LGKVRKKQKGTVKMILQIVVNARRPLAIGELALAFGAAPSSRLESFEDGGINKYYLERHHT
jgi:hypothetical protein